MARMQLTKNNEKFAKKGLSKDIVWNLLGTFCYMFSLWIISILTTNMLGFEAAGVFSLCLVASNIATSFGSYYVRVYYASDVSRRFSDEDYLFTRTLTNIVGVAVAVIYSFAMGYSLDIIGTIMLFYVYKVFELFTEIFSGTFQRYGKMYIGSILMSAKGVAAIPFFILGAYLFHSLNFGFLFMDAAAIAIFFLELWCLYKFASFRLDFKKFRLSHVGKILLVCLPLFIVLLCSNVLPSIPKAMFEKMYTTKEFGYYSSIATISVLIQTAASSILMPIIPKVSLTYLKKDFIAFYKLLGAIIGMVVLMGAASYVAVFFLGDWALGLVFDKSVLQYSYTFKTTIIAGTFTALFVVLNQILAAVGGSLGLIVGSVAGTLACFIVSYPLCKYAYMDGISYSLILSLGLEVLIFLAFIFLYARRRRLGLDSHAELLEEEKKEDSAFSQ